MKKKFCFDDASSAALPSPSTPTALPRLWTPTFLTVILVSLAATGCVDALQAALPILVERLGRDASTGGLTVTIFSFAGIIPFLLSGALADKIGCRRVLTGGAAIYLLGAIGPLVVPGVGPLLVFRALQGIGFAAVNVGAATGATNVLPRSRVGEGLGYFGLGQSLAMALGPTLGLWLVARGSTVLWGAIVAVSALSLIAAALCRCDRRSDAPARDASSNDATAKTGAFDKLGVDDASSTASSSTGAPKRRDPFDALRRFCGLFWERRATLPALLIFILCVGVCGTIVFVGLCGEKRGFGSAGPFFVAASATMIASRLGIGRLFDRLSTLTLFLPTLAATALAFVLLAFAPNRFVFWAAGVPFGFGFGVATPLLSALAVKRTPKERWGAANSTFYLSLNLGFGVGAILGGAAIDAFGFQNAFLLGVSTAAIPTILGLIFLRKQARTPEKSTVSAQTVKIATNE